MAMGNYIDKHNDNPKPFVWTAKASDILENVTCEFQVVVTDLLVCAGAPGPAGWQWEHTAEGRRRGLPRTRASAPRRRCIG
jgi:hypothetical protein